MGPFVFHCVRPLPLLVERGCMCGNWCTFLCHPLSTKRTFWTCHLWAVHSHPVHVTPGLQWVHVLSPLRNFTVGILLRCSMVVERCCTLLQGPVARGGSPLGAPPYIFNSNASGNPWFALKRSPRTVATLRASSRWRAPALPAKPTLGAAARA